MYCKQDNVSYTVQINSIHFQSCAHLDNGGILLAILMER